MTSLTAADRKAELAQNLADVRARIGRACAAARRPASEVTLIAVTKTFPASDIRLLSELEVSDIGENRDQEAAPKAAECAAAGISVTWHFVGQLQVNKVPSVISYADVIHSVDRLRLVTALGRRARMPGRAGAEGRVGPGGQAGVVGGRELTCLVQVSLEDAAGRGGARPADVPALADAIAAEPGLTLGGVMAVAPLGAPPRPAFGKLRRIAESVRSAHPQALVISAGMSGDLEEAIAEGATHVRIGTALLGGRRPFVR